MAFWLNQISWKKVSVFGFLYTVLAFIVRQIEVILTLKYYLNPDYFGVWSKLMMPNAGPPPSSFQITSVVFTFVSGVSLALIYYYLRSHLPESKKQRIFYFADLMVATSFIFFTLPVYLLFNVPFALLVSWFISSFVILVTASYLLVRIIK